MHRHGTFFVVALLIVTTMSWLVLHQHPAHPHHDLLGAAGSNDDVGLKEKTLIKKHPLLQEQRVRKKERGTSQENDLVVGGQTAAAQGTKPIPATTIATTMATTAKCPCPFEVHTFYYAWYENKEVDGDWRHWRHARLDLGIPPDAPHHQFEPDQGQIGTDYWPALGLYSSNDVNTIDAHMQQIASGGMNVIVHSWYPKSKCDDQGGCADKITRQLLDGAAKYGLKLNFHIEPYKGRTAVSLKDDIAYIIEQYGSHPAMHKRNGLPFLYVYDSYLIKPEEWSAVLRQDGSQTIRNTPLDAVVIGLVVEKPEMEGIVRAGFDGFYSYFAAEGFTYASTHANFLEIARFAKQNGLLYVPCIGPGYIDEKIRPWNAANTKGREHGNYFMRGLQAVQHAVFDTWPQLQSMKCAAAAADAAAAAGGGGIVAITSFNEWHEGTQIEPAAVHAGSLDYLPGDPDMYLKLLYNWVRANWMCFT